MSGFCLNSSPNGTMFDHDPSTHDFARKKHDLLSKAYNSVVRKLVWNRLARFCVPQMISIIRQFYDGMRTCIHLDDRK